MKRNPSGRLSTMAMVTKVWIEKYVASLSAFGGTVDKAAVLEMPLFDPGMRTTLTWSEVAAVERGKFRKPFGILVIGDSRGMCWAECMGNETR